MATKKKTTTTTTVTIEEDEDVTEHRAGTTSVSALIDRSGSMITMWQETCNGWDTFLKEQKALKGKVRFSLAFFDGNDPYELVYGNVARKNATGVPDRIQPRGMTPLYDAIGRHIRFLREEMPKTWHHTVVIMTDGMENSSREFTHSSVRALIRQCETDGWQFIFMGANIDTEMVGRDLGIQIGTYSTYDSHTVDKAFAGASHTTSVNRLAGQTVSGHVDHTKSELTKSDKT